MLTPFLVFIFCIIFIASIGKSIGIRRLYVNVLLKIFEFGRINIETAIKRSQKESEESENIIRNNDTKKLQQQNQQYDLQQQQRQQYQQPKQQKVEEEEEDGQGTQRKMNGNGFLPSNQTNGNTVIDRDALILVPDAEFNYKIKDKDISNNKNDEELVNGFSGGDGDNVNDTVQVEKSLDFQLANCLDYVKAGMEAIIEDEVTSRFEAEELKNWNLLTRTNRRYEFISWRLTVIWVCGFFVRYFVLMPLRVFICFIGVSYAVISFALVGCIPYAPLRRLVNDLTFKITFRIIARSISAVIDFHNPEFKPKNCGFCVANHTSPIDIAILATDCSFSLIGQRHGGFLGILQRALARASPHIWFERAEAKDRMAVAKRLRQHVSDPNNPPILIFPEGTCINNTSVMQFKKGSFEVGGVIYPVAIKYDAKFGDAFWNSSRYSMMQYLYLMMTSWAIVCDVWYLPPMYRMEDETAIDFANRVKSVIAKQGGLVDLMWDGQLKRIKPKKEWKEKQQEEFSKRLKGE